MINQTSRYLFALCLMILLVPTSARAEDTEMCIECKVFYPVAYVCDMARNIDRFDKDKVESLAKNLYSDGFKGTIEFIQLLEQMNPLPEDVKNDKFIPWLQQLEESGQDYLSHKREGAETLSGFRYPDLSALYKLYSLFLEKAALDCLNKAPKVEYAKYASRIIRQPGHKETEYHAELVKQIVFIFAINETDIRKMSGILSSSYNDSRLYDSVQFEKEIIPVCERLLNDRTDGDAETLRRRIRDVRQEFAELQARRDKVLSLPALYKELYAATTMEELDKFPSIGGGRIKPDYISMAWKGLDPMLSRAMWAYDRFDALYRLKAQYCQDKARADGLVKTLHQYADMDWTLADTYVLGLSFQDKNHYSSLRDLLYGLNESKKIKEQYNGVGFEVSGFFNKAYVIVFNPGSNREIRYSFVKKYYDPKYQSVHDDKVIGSVDCLVLDRVENEAAGIDEKTDSALAARATVYQRFFSHAFPTEKPFLGMVGDLEIPEEYVPVF